jgi:hypothetical protein
LIWNNTKTIQVQAPKKCVTLQKKTNSCQVIKYYWNICHYKKKSILEIYKMKNINALLPVLPTSSFLYQMLQKHYLSQSSEIQVQKKKIRSILLEIESPGAWGSGAKVPRKWKLNKVIHFAI